MDRYGIPRSGERSYIPILVLKPLLVSQVDALASQVPSAATRIFSTGLRKPFEQPEFSPVDFGTSHPVHDYVAVLAWAKRSGTVLARGKMARHRLRGRSGMAKTVSERFSEFATCRLCVV